MRCRRASPLLVAGLLCGESGLASTAAETDTAPRRLALIVAIQDYPEEGMEFADRLRGPRNDADLISDMLTRDFRFQDDEIRILRDEQATHEAIVRAFHDRLIVPAKEQTEVVFWFTGHGSRVPDESGDPEAEPDGMDTTLIAFDSRVGGRDGDYDITDDELSSLIMALTERTGRILVVTDSCHSGGASRGASRAPVRALPDGERAHDFDAIREFWPEEVEFLDDHEGRPDPTRYVHVAASAAHQRAREYHLTHAWGDEKTWYGALTLFLVSEMRYTPGATSYRKVCEMVRRRIAVSIADQAVQFEGDLDRKLFSDRFDPRPAGYPAHVEDGRIVLEAGYLHGLRRESELRVMAVTGEALGRATVSALEAVSARAAWQTGTPLPATSLALRAVETSRPVGWERLPLRIENPVLSAAARRLSGSRLEPAAERAGAYRLVVEPKDATPDQPARVRLFDADDLRLWPADRDDFPREDWLTRFEEQFPGVLEAEQKYRAVLELSRHPGALPLVARFEELDLADLRDGLERSDGTRRPLPDSVPPLRRAEVGAARGGMRDRSSEHAYSTSMKDEAAGEQNRGVRLDILNAGSDPVHIAVLSVMEDRKIRVVYPGSAASSRALAPGSTRKAYVRLDPHRLVELDRPIRDRYLVIATREPGDYHQLNQPPTRSALRLDPGGIPPLIESALRGSVTRGAAVPVEVTAGYGITALDLWVSRN